MESTFEAVALIEHQGQMTSDGEGQGHYKDNHWYRTNDNKSPAKISQEYVSKKSVVVLYKKINL